MNGPPEKESPPLASKGASFKQNSTVGYHAGSKRQPLSLREEQGIAEDIFGPLTWNGAEAYRLCPGEARHTTRTTATDCRVVCERIPLAGGILAPGVYCWHSSCQNEVEAASYALRTALRSRGAGETWKTPRHPATPKPKPQFDPAKLAKVASKLDGIDGAWLADRSSIRPDTRTPASFLHALYEPGEMVLVFDIYKSQGQNVWTCKKPPFDARELDSFRTGKEQGVWFLTNPIDGTNKPTGQKNPDGTEKLSRRTWQNVTSWRYMVLESDKADPAHWLAALVQMPLRIAAIYTSGGKSIHALVRLDATSKADWDCRRDAMKTALVTLGADPGALSAVRLSRLPGCERLGTTDKAGVYHPYPAPRMQELLYLNPRPTLTPICELPPLDNPEADAMRWQTGEAYL
jgi:hypothetical protein